LILKGRASLSQNEIREILTKYKAVAVVGLSREPDKDSYRVGAYLKGHGFCIIPVNPFADEILGEKSYKSLLDIPTEIQKTIEVVDIFRPAKDVPPIVEQAVKLKEMHGRPYVVWMQLGIVNEQAAETAEKAGLTVVMDKCMMVEHKRFFQSEA
jgi:predicted CoA-binding protein